MLGEWPKSDRVIVQLQGVTPPSIISIPLAKARYLDVNYLFDCNVNRYGVRGARCSWQVGKLAYGPWWPNGRCLRREISLASASFDLKS